ncbi:hypothetical protein QUF91_11975 [Lysinibacillus sp. G4S2]|nr:hypothetical protein [Lysinibacillus sp. G4S2]
MKCERLSSIANSTNITIFSAYDNEEAFLLNNIEEKYFYFIQNGNNI